MQSSPNIEKHGISRTARICVHMRCGGNSPSLRHYKKTMRRRMRSRSREMIMLIMKKDHCPDAQEFHHADNSFFEYILLY